jgi:gliding motility-associated-like protein
MSVQLAAQTDESLVAYFSFDDCTANESNGKETQNGLSAGNIGCECGVLGNSLSFDGLDDQVAFTGPLVNEISFIDFSLSFYFKPFSFNGTQDLISKRVDCNFQEAFAVRYVGRSNSIEVLLSENDSKFVLITAPLSKDNCWQHVAIVRANRDVFLYVNGVFFAEGRTSTRANVGNTSPLQLVGSPCLNITDRAFKGLIDELKLYNRALTKSEIEDLYVAPDKIANTDTLIVLGNAVPTRISNTCASSFTWEPVEGVEDPNNPNTLIRPVVAGVLPYYLIFDDGSCRAKDSVLIRVVDPTALDCNTIFLPSSFTPNNDNLNDTYGISNPFAIEEFVAFEIFDRLGSRVLYSTSPSGRWDGSFNGKPVNPGTFLYRVIYRCNGEELTKTGSVTVIR